MPVPERPFTGCIGVITAQAVAKILGSQKPSCPRLFGIGVMVDSLTLQGKQSNPNIFPKKNAIASLFQPDSLAFNIAHFTTNKESERAQTSEIDELVKTCGKHLQAIEFTSLPSPAITEYVRKTFSGLAIIVTLNNTIMAGMNGSRFVNNFCKEYKRTVDYILFDGTSASRDHTMDVRTVGAAIEAFYQFGAPYRGIMAGGLNPKNTGLVSDVMHRYPGLSFSGKTGLQTQGLFDPQLAIQFHNNLLAEFARLNPEPEMEMPDIIAASATEPGADAVATT